MIDTDALSELTEGYLGKEEPYRETNKSPRQLNNHLVTLAPAQHSEFY